LLNGYTRTGCRDYSFAESKAELTIICKKATIYE